MYARIQSTPPEILKNIGLLSNIGPGPLKNRKATKPEYNRPASETPFKGFLERGFICTFIKVFGSLSLFHES